MGGPRKRLELTRDFYSALVDAYRDKPEHHGHAAKMADTDWRTAKRGWETGWCNATGHGGLHAPWALPIRDVIEQERKDARLRMAERITPKAVEKVEAAVTQDQAMEQVKRDTEMRRGEWASAARTVRRTGMAVLSVQQDIMRILLERAEEWRASVRTMPMDSKTVMTIVRQIGLSMRITSESIQGAQQVEYLAIGQPTEILSLLPGDVGTMSVQEAEEAVERAYHAIARGRKRKALEAGAERPEVPSLSGRPGGVDAAPILDVRATQIAARKPNGVREQGRNGAARNGAGNGAAKLVGGDA